jgi:hypothetical protein
MNPADQMVSKRETTQRQLDGAAAGSFDSLREQLRAVFKERPSRQSRPVEDLHGSDGKLDEPLHSTLKGLQPISLPSKPVADLHTSGDNEQLEDLLRLSPQRKREEEDELERDDLRPGIASYPDHEALEHRANYDLSIENKMTRRSSRGFARYLVAILIGVAATLAWQSYGDVAKQIIATSAPELGSSPEAKQMIAKSIQQLGWTKPPVVESKAAPVAQTTPATPSIDPVQVQQMIQSLAALRESIQQLAAGQKSLAALAQTVDQLAASQDQTVHQIDMLKTSNKEILAKITPTPPPPRAIATPARKPTPTPAPSSPAPVAPPISLAPIPPPDR